MSNSVDKELYITGIPIDTKLGSVRFLTYLEYLQHSQELNAIRQNVLHYYYSYKERFKTLNLSAEEAEEVAVFLEVLKNGELIDFVVEEESIKLAYTIVFGLVLDSEKDFDLESVFNDADIFMQLREMVMSMNYLIEEEVSENEEIQGYINNAKKAKQREGAGTSFSDMLSTVVVGAGLDYSTVLNQTVLQVHAAFYRIAAMKAYEASILFATIPSDKKPEIDSWIKHVDLFENEKEGMSMNQFNKQFGGLF